MYANEFYCHVWNSGECALEIQVQEVVLCVSYAV